MAMGQPGKDRKMGVSGGGWDDGGRGRGSAVAGGVETVAMWRLLHRADSVLERLAWVPSIVLVIAALIIAVQLMDRRPPFEVLRVDPAFAVAGEALTLHAEVWRDQERKCSATMSKYVFDSSGVRWDYPVSMFSAALIQRMEQTMPGALKVAIIVPSNAAPGQAEMVSVLSYQCNRAHALWPIEVTTHMPFMILP